MNIDKLALVVGRAVIAQVLAEAKADALTAENADLRARLAEHENGLPEHVERATATG